MYFSNFSFQLCAGCCFQCFCYALNTLVNRARIILYLKFLTSSWKMQTHFCKKSLNLCQVSWVLSAKKNVGKKNKIPFPLAAPYILGKNHYNWSSIKQSYKAGIAEYHHFGKLWIHTAKLEELRKIPISHSRCMHIGHVKTPSWNECMGTTTCFNWRPE